MILNKEAYSLYEKKNKEEVKTKLANKIMFKDLDRVLKGVVILGLIASGLIVLNFVLGILISFFGG